MANCNLLALDQASKTTGWAIFQNDKLINHGYFTVSDSDLGKRLVKIRKKIETFIKEYNITNVIFEDIQLQEGVGNNVVTFKTLSEVIGVIQELLSEMKIPYEIASSAKWRKTLEFSSSTRTKQKQESQAICKEIFNIAPSEDEADAICIGLHYCIKNNLLPPLAKKNKKVSSGFDWSD